MKNLWRLLHDPFSAFLVNATITAKADLRHISRLKNSDINDLEEVLLEIRSEREFLERRLSIMFGAVEKVGILPGLFVLLYILRKPDWNAWDLWVPMANALFYIQAAYLHFPMMRLDRKIRLLELVIARNKLAPRRERTLDRPGRGQSEAQPAA